MSFHQSPSTYIEHVYLYVTDITKSLRFYTEILGLRVLKQLDKKVELTANGKTTLITIEQPAGVREKQRRRTGLYHYAILLPERSDLADVLRHLLNHNYPLQGASDHLVSEAVYLADPDGNGIELYIDRPADRWTWRKGEVVMATERLDAEDLFQQETGSWKGMPAEAILGHIHLHVSELENIRHFYVEGLGFEITNSQYGSHVLFLATGGYHHHIGVNTWAGEGAPVPDEKTAGLVCYTIQLPDQEAINQTIDRLGRLGYPVEEKACGWFTKDPSGNKIMLQIT